MYYPYDDEHPEQAAPKAQILPPGRHDRQSQRRISLQNGYTQKIYSDAHYVREDESTVPPKYYTPQKSPSRKPKEPKAQSSGSGWVKIVCVALICALLGGFAGGAIMSGKYSSRMDQLESQIAELNKKEEDSWSSTPAAHPRWSSTASGAMAASSIYDLACQQVVGISSEITYSNFLA